MDPSAIHDKERKRIVNKFRGLIRDSRPYIDNEGQRLIRRAFRICSDVSFSKERKLDDPFILYPLGIARIVAREVGLGPKSIASSIIYRFYKDGDISKNKIIIHFGTKVFSLVEGLSKIDDIDTQNGAMQADNFRKLLLSISSDIRVILIKLAERLYVMRKLLKSPKDEWKDIAEESSTLYAPLAHRLGLYNMKTEFEDIGLKFLEPGIYNTLENKIRNNTVNRNRYIQRFTKPIKESLTKQGYNFEIKGRTKSISSIWHKMKKKQIEFDEVYDLFAVRIILKGLKENEKPACWNVYSIVTNIYQPNPRRLRDWISIPKSNGYESLHTTVIGPGKKWVEVQIRTERMNEVAEKGLAAHWDYKGGKRDGSIDNWLNKIRDVLESAEQNNIDDIKLSLYTEEIFVFTPKGELKKFPKGATVVDFAFDIHSDIGYTCTGAKVNNHIVPLRYNLKNGDKVEILTSKTQKPKLDWLDFVITSKAKTKIKEGLKKEKFTEAEDGKELLQRRFRNWKFDFNDKNLNKLLGHYHYDNLTNLYFDIARGRLEMNDLKSLLSEDSETKQKAGGPDVKIEPIGKSNLKHEDQLIIDENINNIDYKLAKCCNPVFGDKIFGFVTVSEGIKIHRNNCPNAQQLLSRYEYRVVKAKWSRKKEHEMYNAVIDINGIDKVGIVNNISSVLSNELKVNINSIAIDTDNGVFEGTLAVMIKDKEHLAQLIGHLKKINGVTAVKRHEDQN